MFTMRTVVAGKFAAVITERITSNSARTRKAIGLVRRQNTNGNIGTAATVRWHAEVVDARQDTGRWEAIGRRVTR